MFPKSFLEPSVMLGILIKWYSLNQPMYFFDEMIGDHDDRIAFELQGFLGVSKVTISAVTLFFIASEVSA